MMSASRCRISLIAAAPAINAFRFLQHRHHGLPAAVVQPLVKAGPSTGMAGDAADLLDLQHNGIGVAVEQDCPHPLSVAGALPLAPQPAAGARPVYRLTPDD